MKISIFTPTHNPSYLTRLFNSLLKQDYENWEWVIVPNNGAIIPQNISNYNKVKIFKCEDSNFIGYLKHFACMNASGDIFLEVDHDDELFPNALSECALAFNDETIDFVYSNSCDVDKDYNPRSFNPNFGWDNRECEYNGHKLIEVVSFPPDPRSISKIWFAPNHFRAWKASFYKSIGGHNVKLDILDDHELICRTYLKGKMKHIDKPLYVYHVHENNTCYGEKQLKIQNGTLELHDYFIRPLVNRWCEINKFPTIDIKNFYKDCNLDYSWPFADNSIGAFYADDILQYLENPFHIMKEFYRCLVPNGWLFINVPSTDGRGAFQNPLNKSYWNQNNFLYYTSKNFATQINSNVRFQSNRIKNYFPTPYHKDFNILYTSADLVKLVGDERQPGGAQI